MIRLFSGFMAFRGVPCLPDTWTVRGVLCLLKPSRLEEYPAYQTPGWLEEYPVLFHYPVYKTEYPGHWGEGCLFVATLKGVICKIQDL